MAGGVLEERLSDKRRDWQVAAGNGLRLNLETMAYLEDDIARCKPCQ